MELVEAPMASRQMLERVHRPDHVAALQQFCEAGGGMIDADTIATDATWEAALRGAGAAASGAERLLASSAADGGWDFAFCATRPPGHHAESARAMGFCLFNHAAVAAAHALAACDAERVLVLDWDVHHGNGTAEIFDASSEVLYASIHQSPLYPGTGMASEIGTGAGEGYTVNLPVPPGSGGDEFLGLIQHVVAPIARDFDPSLILLSAGFDAHADDPLANCELSTADYADMAAAVRDLGRELGAPVVVSLEGGYDPDALAASVLATVRALGGAESPRRAPVEGPAVVTHRELLSRGRWVQALG